MKKYIALFALVFGACGLLCGAMGDFLQPEFGQVANVEIEQMEDIGLVPVLFVSDTTLPECHVLYLLDSIPVQEALFSRDLEVAIASRYTQTDDYRYAEAIYRPPDNTISKDRDIRSLKASEGSVDPG